MRIYLRPITENDGEQIVRWRNSLTVSNHCLNKEPITIESHTEFYKANVETGRYIQFIVERIDGDYGVSSYAIATVFLKDMDYFNKRCELCIFTSDDDEWNIESQSIAISLLLEKAFNEYGMRKIYSYVFSKYTEEADRLIQAGFSMEAVLKEEALDRDGTPLDLVRYSIIRE